MSRHDSAHQRFEKIKRLQTKPGPDRPRSHLSTLLEGDAFLRLEEDANPKPGPKPPNHRISLARALGTGGRFDGGIG